MENSPAEQDLICSFIVEDLYLTSPKRLCSGTHKHLSCQRSPSNAKTQCPVVTNLFPLPTTTTQLIDTTQHQYQNHESQSHNILFIDHHLHQKESKEIGLTRRFFKQLKRLKVSKSSQSCSVCQQQFQKDELIIQLPCKHIFHKTGCLNEWLKVSVYCPICKLNLETYFRQQEKIEGEKSPQI